jgi:serine/threonine protein kinase
VTDLAVEFGDAPDFVQFATYEGQKECVLLSQATSQDLSRFVLQQRGWGVCWSRQAAFSLLELAEGGDMAAFKELLTPDELRYVACQLLAGLVQLHEHMGIEHADVKPANLLIRGDGTIKIHALFTSLSSF